MLLPKTSKADVTPVRQRTQFTCMAASMCMCLKAYGVQDCDEDTVNKVMGAQPMKGASWEQALACAQHYGMRATLTSPCTVKQLKAWTDAGTPVMIAWNPEGREWSHASVVFDVDDDHNVSVADPNIPDPDETVRVMPKSEFYKKWYEKWPDYLVRRPAMAIEREITPEGRQVMAGDKSSLLVPMVTNELLRQRMKKKQQGSKPWKPEPHPTAPRYRDMFVPKHEPPKPKSFWERVKETFGGDKDAQEPVTASGLTQPLMTRRDYGVAMDLENKTAGVKLNWELNRIMGALYAETEFGTYWLIADEGFYRVKLDNANIGWKDTQDLARKLAEVDYQKRLRTKAAKFERGVSMTVDEVADVVGPEFKEMNENPPESVQKVKETMQKKAVRVVNYLDVLRRALANDLITSEEARNPKFITAAKDAADRINDYWPEGEGFGSSDMTAVVKEFLQYAGVDAKYVGGFLKRLASGTRPLVAVDTFADMLKDAKFERGVSVPLEDLPEELQENVENPPPAVQELKEDMQEGKAAEGILAMGVFADMLKDSKFEKGKPADPTENMSPEDAAEWERQNEEHKDEFKAADFLGIGGKRDDGAEVPFDLFFNRSAAVMASGKWGFTKAVEGACMAGVNKLQKAASRIAKDLYAKDEGSPAFLQKHATRGMSKTAALLLAAMEGMGPLAGLNKTAGRSGNGLYGFSSKTAKLGLDACTALHHEAGEIACDLFARKGTDPMKLAGFLKKNATRGKCAYSAMLSECAPELAGTKVAADFLAAEEDFDEDAEVAKVLSYLDGVKEDEGPVGLLDDRFSFLDDRFGLLDDRFADESTSPSFLDDRAPGDPKC